MADQRPLAELAADAVAHRLRFNDRTVEIDGGDCDGR
jgi:hypothetical protein